MRKLVYDLLSEDAVLRQWVPKAGFVERNAELTQLPRPFIVLPQVNILRGMGHSRRFLIEAWVYDDLGSYNRIDQICRRIERTMEDVAGLVTETAAVTTVEWTGRSADLTDDVVRANVRSTGFQLIGREL